MGGGVEVDDGTSDTVSAELLDGGAILVGDNATLEEGREALVGVG